ncbi:MAG: ACP S-malonyltransferase [Bacillota bacterium]|uniref:Malonyl CoA-acyl carrier protein transacylase n=1 Tax=Thermanaerosceptrum fracticalcis TaxID=1712410 RepID=A0A7G6E1J4_THEFR|nr:ACP S-malonyltransferase [Thermanaerosceptrum fracticalcis]QNB45948.1 ACP S-malonyltransferase [Thermanaerosceptrum fracticalcis]
MKKTAFVFPGQGSQYVGMGKEFYNHFPLSREVFEQVDERLGVSLSEICFSGPEEELKLTINTQPAILTTSVAILKVVEKEGIKPDFVAGHSLGEYSALVAAGSLSYTDAAWLVRQRGVFMQEAVPPGEGTMAAIMGLDQDKVEALCREVSDVGVVEPANYNCPGQIAIAGATPAVQKALILAKTYGAKRAVLLPVSGPFHSSLLRPASVKLKEVLEKVQISPARIPVVANITAEITTDPAEIRQNLIDQVSGSVRWEQSILKLIDLGASVFVEIGPGKVLSGLIKKIAKEAEIYNIEDMASLGETILKLKEGM